MTCLRSHLNETYARTVDRRLDLIIDGYLPGAGVELATFVARTDCQAGPDSPDIGQRR